MLSPVLRACVLLLLVAAFSAQDEACTVKLRLPNWGQLPEFDNCTLHKTWPELAKHEMECMHPEGGRRSEHCTFEFTTGGLGDLLQPHEFHVWVCVKHDPCMGAWPLDSRNFCYVYDEKEATFIPWNTNSELNLCEDAPSTTPSPNTCCECNKDSCGNANPNGNGCNAPGASSREECDEVDCDALCDEDQDGNEECDVDNGGCDHICTNTDGSRTCSCNTGYTLSGDGMTCDDIDECSTNNGGCDQSCINVRGSRTCSCNPGYTLSEDGVTCDDIDECRSGVSSCEQECTNTIGAFTCSCYPGYLVDPNNGDNCVDEFLLCCACGGNSCENAIRNGNNGNGCDAPGSASNSLCDAVDCVDHCEAVGERILI